MKLGRHKEGGGRWHPHGHGATSAQVSAVIDHIIDAVRRPEGWTRYGSLREATLAVDPKPPGPAQINQILANFSAATLALGYSYVNVLVRKEDENIGEGFWNYIDNYLNRELGAPKEREN